MWVGLIQSIEDLERAKRLTFSQIRENSPCLTAFRFEHSLFPVLGLELKLWLFLGLEPVRLPTGTTPLALLGTQVDSHCRSCNLSVSIIESIPHNLFLSLFFSSVFPSPLPSLSLFLSPLPLSLPAPALSVCLPTYLSTYLSISNLFCFSEDP